jgi:hypothetical protein
MIPRSRTTSNSAATLANTSESATRPGVSQPSASSIRSSVCVGRGASSSRALARSGGSATADGGAAAASRSPRQRTRTAPRSSTWAAPPSRGGVGAAVQ